LWPCQAAKAAFEIVDFFAFLPVFFVLERNEEINNIQFYVVVIDSGLANGVPERVIVWMT
jgi:hypothetical protein